MVVTSYAWAFLHNLVLITELLATITAVLLIAHSLGNAFGFIPTNPTTQRVPVSLRRGKRVSVCNVPTRPLFHPDAHAQLQHPNDSFFRWIMWLVDEVFAPAVKAIASAGLAFVVAKLQGVFSMQNIKARVAPLRTRLKRGIAQVAALQGAFTSRTAAFGIPYRYLRPASCLFALFVGLAFVIGTPVGITALSCSGGFLVVVVRGIGGIRTSKPQEDEKEYDKDEEDDDNPLDADVPTTNILDLAPAAALQAQI